MFLPDGDFISDDPELKNSKVDDGQIIQELPERWNLERSLPNPKDDVINQALLGSITQAQALKKCSE